MTITTNAAVDAVRPAPIAEAQAWIPKRPSQRHFINLSQAVPSYPPAEELRDAIAAAAHASETGFYTVVLGLPELREEVAVNMASEYGGRIRMEDVAIAAGCNQAFCAVLSAIAGPGDNVLLPVPWYFNHQMWLDMQRIGIHALPIDVASGAPDPQAAGRLIDQRTRAIVLVTPNNPTGAIYTPDCIHRFYELARSRNLALVIDETYKDFRPDSGRTPAHQLFTDPGWRDTLVQLYSFSKAYALTGYRVGTVISGPEVAAGVEKIIDCFTICAPRIGQVAALFGLRHLEAWKREKSRMMQQRLDALVGAFRMPQLDYQLISAGAYFAYVRHPFGGESAVDVARRLASENDLLVLPGSMFGPDQEGFLRLAFANVDAELMPEMALRFLESQGKTAT